MALITVLCDRKFIESEVCCTRCPCCCLRAAAQATGLATSVNEWGCAFRRRGAETRPTKSKVTP
eukprot:6214708-Pleurochrysis_carterae.AAC.2